MTAVEVAQMTKAEAEKLTLRINRDGLKLGELLLQAHDGRAWAVLGYRSWSAYIASEFTFSRATSYRLLAAEREPDALVQGSECLTDETDGAEDSANGPLVAAVDIDQRPLDTITPDVVLPAPALSAPRERARPTQERLAPPEPPNDAPAPPERLPSLRQHASAVVDALQDAEEGCGAKWTPEEATFVDGFLAREMANWRRAHGLAQPEQAAPRSPGRVIKPEDRQPRSAASNGANYPIQPSLARREVTPMFKKAAK